MTVTRSHMTVRRICAYEYLERLSNSGKVIDFVSFSYEPNTSVSKIQHSFCNYSLLCITDRLITMEK